MANRSEETGAANRGPVGQGKYLIKPGDCIDSIAYRFSHHPATIWNHPDNAELKSIRENPNVLLKGDRLTVPEIQTKKVTGATEERHLFVRRGRVKLRLLILHYPYSEDADGGEPETDEDDEGELDCSGEDVEEEAEEEVSEPEEILEEPWADAPYELDLDGRPYEGSTDGDGWLEEWIPPNSERGFLRVGEHPHQHEFNIVLGTLDPVDALSGVQQRLNNLGFESGKEDGIMGPITRGALLRFQVREELDKSREPDKATRQRLVERHGS